MAKYTIVPGISKSSRTTVEDSIATSLEDMLLKMGDELVKGLRASYLEQYAKVYPGRTTSRNLYQSITPSDVTVKVNGTQAILEFRMEQYGIFLDQGVKGRFPGRAPNSPFKFKKKNLPISVREGIVRDGGFKGINTAKEAKTLSYLIGRSITKKGLKPVPFFTEFTNGEFKDNVLKELNKILGDNLIDVIIGIDLRQ